MKILYIITQAEMGGAQKYVLDLAQATGGEIAAGIESSELFLEAEKRGLTTYSLRYLRRAINPGVDLAAITEIQRLIKKSKPDIVHLNSTKAGILGSCAAIGLGCKVVFTAHGFVFNEPLSPATKAFYRFAEKFCSSFRDMVIAVSDADRESALRYKIVPPSKIITIHNGIDKIDFLDRAEAQAELGIGAGKITIGTIGHFYKNKGLDTFVQSLALISKELTDRIQVTMIGSGQEIGNLKLEIGNLHLDSLIKLEGTIPQASRYLKAFDIFVLPSRKEGFSYVLLEAMQAGLPIVATDVGGNREALGDSGIIIPADDKKALADAITKLVSDERLHSAFAQKLAERSQLFTKEKMLEQTLAVYRKLMQK